MREVERAEFTNVHNDKVKVTLLEDSFGGFHLITKCKGLRRSQEQRVVGMAMVAIPVNTYTETSQQKQIPNYRTALIEFKLECAMNYMPGFNMQEWLTEFNEEEGN